MAARLVIAATIAAAVASAVASVAAAAGDTQPVLDLISRNFGPEASAAFELKIRPGP